MYLAHPQTIEFLSTLISRSPRLPYSKVYLASTVFAIYLLLVRLLRFRRVSVLKKKYGLYSTTAPKQSTRFNAEYAGRPDLKLTPEEAQKIVHDLTQLEMPGLTRTATTLALFKTYAIPSISEILLGSGQLSTSANVARRVADTTVLLSVPVTCPWVDCSRMNLAPKEVDSRGALAIARINWLHSHWPSIRNDDYVYTLSLFVLEPIRWTKKFGWRDMLPVEREAYFVLWREIGLRMNIRDIPETLEELLEWSTNYEETNMIPAKSNFEVGMHTLNLLQDLFPKTFGVSAFFQQIIISLLEERVRAAFMLPPPSSFVRSITTGLVNLIAYRNRYLSLPRVTRVLFFTSDLSGEQLRNPLPRMHLVPVTPQKEPWYEPERTGFRRLIESVKVNLGLSDSSTIPGLKYKSEGFRLEECGPVALEQTGHEEVMRMAAAMQGCPVSGAWAR